MSCRVCEFLGSWSSTTLTPPCSACPKFRQEFLLPFLFSHSAAPLLGQGVRRGGCKTPFVGPFALFLGHPPPPDPKELLASAAELAFRGFGGGNSSLKINPPCCFSGAEEEEKTLWDERKGRNHSPFFFPLVPLYLPQKSQIFLVGSSSSPPPKKKKNRCKLRRICRKFALQGWGFVCLILNFALSVIPSWYRITLPVFWVWISAKGFQ